MTQKCSSAAKLCSKPLARSLVQGREAQNKQNRSGQPEVAKQPPDRGLTCQVNEGLGTEFVSPVLLSSYLTQLQEGLKREDDAIFFFFPLWRARLRGGMSAKARWLMGGGMMMMKMCLVLFLEILAGLRLDWAARLVCCGACSAIEGSSLSLAGGMAASARAWPF